MTSRLMGKPFPNRMIEISENQSFCDGQSLTRIRGVDVASISPDLLYFTNTESRVVIPEDHHHN